MSVFLLKKIQGFLILTIITGLALLYHLPDITLSSRLKKQAIQDTRVESHQHRTKLSSASLTPVAKRYNMRLDEPGTKYQPLRGVLHVAPSGRIGRNNSRMNAQTGSKNRSISFNNTPKGVIISNNDSKIYINKLCDDDCQALLTLFSSWPEERPRAAFYYLSQLSRLAILIDSLASVDKYFNNQFQYPVIIFHEGDLTSRRDYIRKRTKSQVFFQLVQFSIPDFLPKPVPRSIPCISSVSYRHMCRFHARNVYEEPTMTQLQYYWRLDDDSLLLSNVSYDVFKFMKRKSLQYGYLWRHWDSLTCVEGLWEATKKYIADRGLKTEFFSSWKKGYLYYNNFEISSTEMWLSDKYKSYIKYIDRLGGIFYNRWGDAPLHGIAVSMFIPKKQTHHFHDIGYQHGSYTHLASKQ